MTHQATTKRVKIAQDDTLDTDSSQSLRFYIGHFRNKDKEAFHAFLGDLASSITHGKLNSSTRATLLAACWATGHRLMFDQFLNLPRFASLPEILRAVQLLDSRRVVRQLTKRLERLTSRNEATPGAVKSTTLSKLKRKINAITNNTADLLPDDCVGVTSSLGKRVAKWLSDIPKRKLEYYLLAFPTKNWKQLIDLLHIKPSEFDLEYFQKCVFEGVEAAPDKSFVGQGRDITPKSVSKFLTVYPYGCNYYSFIRRKVDPSLLDDKAKKLLVKHAPLEDVLWYYSDFKLKSHAKQKDLEDIILKRLLGGEKIIADDGRHEDGAVMRANYGKLMEQLLHFRSTNAAFVPHLMDIAESQLEDIKRDFAGKGDRNIGKVAVLGDASGSMQVAVKTATIVASIACAALGAELVFFNNKSFQHAIKNPSTVSDVLDVAETIRATGGTTCAAGLQFFLDQAKPRTKTPPKTKEAHHDVVDLFIIVTDEGENGKGPHGDFLNTYKTYLEQVNPEAQMYFVSFTSGNNEKRLGRMLQQFAAHKVPTEVFRLDPYKPDLTKLDILLNHLKYISWGRQNGDHDDDTDEKMDEDTQMLLKKIIPAASLVGGTGDVVLHEEFVLLDIDDVSKVC